MKSAGLLICSVVFLFFATMEFDSIDDVGLKGQARSHSTKNEIAGKPISVFEHATRNIQKTIDFVDREEKKLEASGNIPFTMLLITGLFGFAFWDRSSLNGRKGRRH